MIILKFLNFFESNSVNRNLDIVLDYVFHPTDMVMNFFLQHFGFVWLSSAIFLLILEIGTPGLFYFISFAIGCALASLGAFIGVSFVVQCVTCLITSIVSFFLLRHYLINSKKFVSRARTNTDALIGLRVVVTATILPHLPGRVDVKGEEWVAVSENKSLNLQPGTEVLIVRVEGNKLVVK